MPEFMNLTTGQIKSKKQPKEKTPEELMMAEMKKLNKKRFDLHIVISLLCSNSGHMTTYMIFLCFPIRCFISGDPRWKNLVNDIDGCLKGIEEYSVRNSAELVTCLHHLCQRI